MANEVLLCKNGTGDSSWLNTEVVASGHGENYPVMSKGIASAIAGAIGELPKGVIYKGAVDYYSLLPAEPEVGDCYTVKYAGSEGTTVSGAEYVWGLDGESNAWIKMGDDLSLYAKLTDIPVATNVPNSEAEDVAGCVTSINAILTALKTAGIMEADTPPEEE